MHLKTAALRNGAWFKVLQRIDRVLFNLTIKVVVCIRSIKLQKSIRLIISKLEDAMGRSCLAHLKKIGLPLAQKISFMAQKIGNISASGWAFDSSFVVFLAVMHINKVKTFKL